MEFKLDKKYFKIALYSIVLIEFFSLYAFAFPILNKIFFVLILLGALFLTWRNLFYGVLIVLAELIIASKGYLFYFEANEKAISIRIGLFVVVMSVFVFKVFVKLIKTKKLEITFLKSKLFPYFLILFLFIIYGVVFGVVNKNGLPNVFFDFNGWLYFLLAFPIFEVITPTVIPSERSESRPACSVDRDLVVNKLFSVLFAALTTLILKTFFLLFIFSHNFISIMPEIYRWIRVTGVGEIAKMETGFYRVFLQSHIYAVLSFFIFFPLLNKKFIQRKESVKKNLLFLILVIFLTAVIIISFSRSFWVGIIATFFIFYGYLFFAPRHLFCNSDYSLSLRDLLYFWRPPYFFKKKIKFIIASLLLALLLFTAGIGLTGFLIKAPIPFREKQDIDFASAMSKRAMETSGEAAIGSRWGLFGPLWKETKNNFISGAGFGKTVTYKTEDPRALENNPDGLYTTYAFEWGYLDIWLKLGIFGLLAYLLLLFQILKTGWQKYKYHCEDPATTGDVAIPLFNSIIFGSLLGITALTVIHFFTPYLNHPLGIGYLLLWSAIYGER